MLWPVFNSSHRSLFGSPRLMASHIYLPLGATPTPGCAFRACITTIISGDGRLRRCTPTASNLPAHNLATATAMRVALSLRLHGWPPRSLEASSHRGPSSTPHGARDRCDRPAAEAGVRRLSHIERCPRPTPEAAANRDASLRCTTNLRPGDLGEWLSAGISVKLSKNGPPSGAMH